MFSNRSISIPALVFLGICGFSTAGFAATYGDLNCDASVNVVDVQISILKTLGEPLDVVIDGDGNGIPDACDAEITGTCGEGTIALDGECVIDPAALQGVADTAYADGYADGIAAADLMGSYADGYDDALGMCVELGGSTGACTNYSDLAALDGMTDEVMDSIWSGCFQSCFFSEDTKGCLDDCVSEAAGLTSECGACFASGVYDAVGADGHGVEPAT